MTLSPSEFPAPTATEQEENSVSPEAVAEVEQKAEQKNTRKQWPQLAVRAGVTIVLFLFLARSISWPTLITTLLHVHHTELLLGLVTGLLCVVFSAYNWRSLVLAERIRMDLARLIDLYLVGIAFSHFLPTSMGGDAVKAYYVGTESGNMAGSTSAVVLSRITSFVGMLLITFPALIVVHTLFTGAVITWFLLLSLLLLSTIAGTLVIATLLPHLSARWLKGAWTKHRFFQLVLEIGNAISEMRRRPRSLSSAVLFGMLFWITSFLNYYIYAAALGLHIPLSFYVIAIPFISIIAALPISINGFGLRESAFVYILSTIHVPAAASLLLALLMDAQTLLFGILGGCVYLMMSSKKTTNEVQNG